MIRPTARTLGLVGLALPIAALPTLLDEPGAFVFWVGAVATIVVLLVVEFALLPPRRSVQIALEAPASAPFGEPVPLVLRGIAARSTTATVLLDVDGPAAPLPPAHLPLSPARTTTAELRLVPARRGTVRVPLLHARWRGPLGLLFAEHTTPLEVAIAVLPNVNAVRQRALAAVQRREFQSGLRVERYIGDGSEFEALRDYVTGMDRRGVDWKASARHRTLLCREFRAERDHAVVLCIDTGRLMREPLDGAPRLDHAIHTALQLGYVCLRTGDRVGMFAFADQPQHFVPPQSGVHALEAIQQRMATLDYRDVETNFTFATTDLLQRLRRRSLVVLFTDFVDSITGELMLQNVQWLARRHLLLFVAMRDPMLDELTRREPREPADLHRAVVAGELVRERDLVLERIRKAGAQVLDAGTAELSPQLIDRYLAVKRRELL